MKRADHSFAADCPTALGSAFLCTAQRPLGCSSGCSGRSCRRFEQAGHFNSGFKLPSGHRGWFCNHRLRLGLSFADFRSFRRIGQFRWRYANLWNWFVHCNCLLHFGKTSDSVGRLALSEKAFGLWAAQLNFWKISDDLDSYHWFFDTFLSHSQCRSVGRCLSSSSFLAEHWWSSHSSVACSRTLSATLDTTVVGWSAEPTETRWRYWLQLRY